MHLASFLFQASSVLNVPQAADAALKLLERVCRGGICDPVSGGIFRYSTDDRWLVPHYEKMLADNALFINACLDGWQRSGRSLFLFCARRALRWLLTRLQNPNGTFAAATDADSGGGEGAYYALTPQDVRESGANRPVELCELLGLSANQPIPHLSDGADIGALPVSELDRLDRWRDDRSELLVGQLVMTSWNGLACAALARFGRLNCPEAARAAERSGLWLKGQLDAGKPAFLEDWAFPLWGLWELYQANPSRARAEYLAEKALQMINKFAGAPDGGLWDSVSGDVPPSAERFEGGRPTGNAVAAFLLARLAAVSQRQDIWDAWEKIKNSLSFDLRLAQFFGMAAQAAVSSPERLIRVAAPAGEAQRLSQALAEKQMPLAVIAEGGRGPVAHLSGSEVLSTSADA